MFQNSRTPNAQKHGVRFFVSEKNSFFLK